MKRFLLSLLLVSLLGAGGASAAIVEMIGDPTDPNDTIERKDTGAAFSADEFNRIVDLLRGMSRNDNGTYADQTDDLVGINGITNPTEALDVNGRVKATYFLGDGSLLTGLDTGYWIQTGGEINYPTGNVGIGIADPTSNLEVNSANDTGIRITTTATDGSSFLQFKQVGNRGAIGYIDNDQKMRFATASNAGAPGIFGSSTRMLIDVAGDVGIGTEDPTYKLDINDDAASGAGLRVAGGGGGQPIAVFQRDVGGTGSMVISSGANNPQFYLNNSGASQIFSVGVDGSDFKISDGTAVGTNDRLTIDNAGNVGIGTTSPGALLDLRKDDGNTHLQTVGSGGNLRFRLGTDSSANVTMTTGNSVDLRMGVGAADDIVVKSSGNVGIGTTNPTNLLHLTSTGNYPGINFTGTSGPTTTTGRIQYEGGTGSFYYDATGGGDHFFRGNGGGNYLMSIKDDGNVGIGTTGPSQLLQIAGSNANLQITDTDTNADFYVLTNSTAGGAVLSADHNDEVSNSYLDLNVDGTNRMRIAGGGNVGIGTTSPSSKLHVAGSSLTSSNGATFLSARSYTSLAAGTTLELARARGTEASPLYPVTGNTLGQIKFRNQDSVGTTAGNASASIKVVATEDHASLDGGAEMVFSTSPNGSYGPVDRLTISQDGQVGIGVADPTHRLHVSGQARIPEVIFDPNNNGASDKASIVGAGGTVQVFTDSTFDFYESDANTRQFRFDLNSGLFGVKTDPAYEVDVAGDINFTGDLYQNGAPYGGGGKFEDGTPTATEAVYMDGNVGIGIADPISALHVASSGQTELTISGDGSGYHNGAVVMKAVQAAGRGLGIFMHNSVNDEEWFAGRPYNDGNAYMIGHKASVADHDPSTSTYTNALLTVKDSGNVGIGITTPAYTLDVNDDAASGAGLRVAGGGSGQPIAVFQRDVGGTGSMVISSNGSDPQFYLNSGANIFSVGVDGSSFKISDSAAVGTTDRFVIDSDGDVGIGTSSPASKLQIVDGGQRIQFLTGTNSSGYGLDIGINDDGVNFDIGSGSRGFNFSNNGGTHLVVSAAGNVGIGTTSPGALLDVQSSRDLGTNSNPNVANFTAEIVSGTAALGFGQSGGTPTIAGYGTGTSYNIALNPTAGSVGVGTASPRSETKLHIVGSGDDQLLTLEDARPTIFFKENDTTNENWQIRNDGGVLQFEQQNDAGSAASDMMNIQQNGDVDIANNLAVGANASNIADNTLVVDDNPTVDGTSRQIYSYITATSPTLTADADTYGFYSDIINNKTENVGAGFDSDATAIWGRARNTGTNSFRYNVGVYGEGRNDSTGSDLGYLYGTQGFAYQNAMSGNLPGAYGAYGQVQGDPTSGSTSSISNAMANYGIVNNYNSDVTNAYGGYGYVYTVNGYTGDIANAYGVRGYVSQDSDDGGNITRAYGGHFQVRKRATSPNIPNATGAYIDVNGATNAYGLEVYANDSAATNNYGIYVEANSASNSNFAIYAQSGDIGFSNTAAIRTLTGEMRCPTGQMMVGFDTNGIMCESPPQVYQ